MIVNNDLWHNIFSYLSPEQRGPGGRVEKIGLYANMAAVCKDLRQWVFSTYLGPFKPLGSNIKALVPLSPLETPLRNFIGILNDSLEKSAKEWFEYIQAIEQDSTNLLEKITIPINSDPNVLDFSGMSPLERAIPLLLEDAKYEFLLDLFCRNGMNATTIQSALPFIFSKEPNKVNITWEQRFNLADKFIHTLQQYSNEEKLPYHVLQPHVSRILSLYGNTLKTPDWLLNRSLNWNVNDLAKWMESNLYERTDFFPMFSHLVNCMAQPIDTPLECGGDHLIHFIIYLLYLPFGGCYPAKYRHFVSCLRFILEKAPHEIEAKSCRGVSVISLCIYYKFDALLNDIKDFISEESLWRLHNDCLQNIIKILLTQRLEADFKTNNNKILEFLKILKPIFFSEERFECWLKNNGEDGLPLLHYIALYSPCLIESIFKESLLTNTETIKSHFKDFDIEKLRNMQEGIFTFFDTAINGDLECLEKIPCIDVNYASQFIKQLQTLGGISPVEHIITNFLIRPTIRQRYLQILRLLLQWDFYTTDKKGNTLLHTLFSYQHRHDKINYVKELIALLLNHGIDPFTLNNDHETAIDIAKKNKWNHVLHMME